MRVEQSSSLSPTSLPSLARLPRLHTAGRWLLLLLILFAFARLTWQLDAKNLWWDESLSLQRAESGWVDLLIGRIVISDRLNDRPTVDQHPFSYFALLRLFVRMVGESEFVLRFPSVMASTLLLPGLWVLARLFARRGVLPAQTAPLALFLAAANPFYLWYGQEARMYTLVALLAVVSTYLLLRWAEETDPRLRWLRLAAYGGAALAFVTSHYFAALLLPVHGLVLVFGVRHRRRLALFLTSGGLLAVAGAVGVSAWLILRQPHSGANFVSLPFSVLLSDLLNAYSMGLSVNIDRVWWLDLVFGGLALLGIGWSMRPRGWRMGGWRMGGWLLPVLLMTPIVLLVVVNQFQPAYMNARHLSVVSGFFLLLVSAGIGLLWQRHWAVGGLVCLVLAGGMGYSTVNYFSLPEYRKDNFVGVGRVLSQEMMPGDVLLINPPHMQRLFRYYLPVDTITAAEQAGVAIHWWGMPLLADWTESEALLSGLAGSYRRVWLVTSGMYPYGDPGQRVEAWLDSNGLRIWEWDFNSPNSSLELGLFLLGGPVTDALPADVTPVQARFGDAIELVGYRVGAPLWPGAAIPVTYYWRGLRPLDERYKYLARVESPGIQAPGLLTEREFYDGFVPSIWWTPGTLIVEESSIPGDGDGWGEGGTLSLQLYAADSLAKLQVVATQAGVIADDGQYLQLPFPLFGPEFGVTPENRDNQ